MLVFIFVIVCGLLKWKRICTDFPQSFAHICIVIGDPVIKRGELEIQLSRGKNWRSSYQEGRIGDPDIKSGELEIQLSRGNNWRSSYQEGRIGIPLTGLTPPHVLHVPRRF